MEPRRASAAGTGLRDETARRRETVPAFPYISRVSSSPREFIAGVGEIFAVFDYRTQDSGNASYGVEVGGRRYFVKTAGDPDDDDSARLNHAERVGLLRNAAELARSVRHPALPKFHGVVESPRAPFRGSDAQYEATLTSCRQTPDERFQTAAQFRAAWMSPDWDWAYRGRFAPKFAPT